MPEDFSLRSPLLPGGDLISAVLNRQVMAYADRGGASGLVGQRWADHCDDHVQEWVGGLSDIPGGSRPPIRIDRIARLDAQPAIARAASKRGLQNPDFLFIGHRDGHPAIQAADAKFSIETARARQVSPEVVERLLTLGSIIEAVTGPIDPASTLEPGFFLSPDFPLTAMMLRRRNGIVRATVRQDEVEALEVDAAAFFAPVEGHGLMPVLARVDRLGVSIDESLLAGLYYFRLARAVIGFWLDSVKPLLLMGDKVAVDETAVIAQARERADRARSAWELVLAWDADVERVRANRQAVEHVAGLPIVNRELRELILRVAGDLDVEPPSMNQVRRRLGSWFKGEIRAKIGPLEPPIADLPAALRSVASVAAEIAPRIPGEATRIVLELVAVASDEETAEAADPDASAGAALPV